MFPICNRTACKVMEQSPAMGFRSHYSICLSQLKFKMKMFWLQASVLYEQLINSVQFKMACLCSLYTEQSINCFCQKLTFFFKFNKFHPLKLSELGLKFRHVYQLRTEIQFYKAVDTKSSVKFKTFSSDMRSLSENRLLRCQINQLCSTMVR